MMSKITLCYNAIQYIKSPFIQILLWDKINAAKKNQLLTFFKNREEVQE
jgi:hypothetical protein